jgi:hypothetical protein
MKAPKGKTLVRINIESETQLIQDEHGRGTAYATKQIGSIIVATDIRRENANAFDPLFGEVVSGEHAGKTAWFHKLCYREAKAYGNQNHLLTEEEVGEQGTFLLIEDGSIFFYTAPKELTDEAMAVLNKPLKETIRYDCSKPTKQTEIWSYREDILMTPEWTLCEPIEDVTWEYVDGIKIKCRATTGGLIIPAMNEAYKTGKAILRHVHPSVKEELGLNEGDVVFLDRACDLPVEDELNMKLGKMYFRVEVCNILGVEVKELEPPIKLLAT